MDGQSIRVLLIGDHERGELREAAEWLKRNASCTCCLTMAAARLHLQQCDAEPHVIAVAQPRRGCFSAADIEALHRAVPLARLTALLGTWCEGETRSGTPWPGVIRTNWHEWVGAADARWLEEVFPSWAMPRTATLAELQDARHLTDDGNGRLIGIDAHHFTDYEALAHACQASGYRTVRVCEKDWSAAPVPVAVIWDRDDLDAERADELARLTAAVGSSPVITVLGFPRLDDWEAARRCGAVGLVGKPFVVHDLLAQLSGALRAAELSKASPKAA